MKKHWILLALVAGLFALAVLPPILAGISTTVAWEDQAFHIAEINHFIGHPFALLDYPVRR